jgi:hypothetical protein
MKNDDYQDSLINEIKVLKLKLNEKNREAEDLERMNQGFDNNRSRYERLESENMKYKQIINDLIKNYNKSNDSEIKLILANLSNSAKKGNLFEEFKNNENNDPLNSSQFDQLLDRQIKRVESYYDADRPKRKFSYNKFKNYDGQRNYAIYKHKHDQDRWKDSLRGSSSDIAIDIQSSSKILKTKSQDDSMTKEESKLYFCDRIRSTSPQKSIKHRKEKTNKEVKYIIANLDLLRKL